MGEYEKGPVWYVNDLGVELLLAAEHAWAANPRMQIGEKMYVENLEEVHKMAMKMEEQGEE